MGMGYNGSRPETTTFRHGNFHALFVHASARPFAFAMNDPDLDDIRYTFKIVYVVQRERIPIKDVLARTLTSFIAKNQKQCKDFHFYS